MKNRIAQRIALLGLLLTWGCIASTESEPADSLETEEAMFDDLEEQESSLVVGKLTRCGGPLALSCSTNEICVVPSATGTCPSPNAFGKCQARSTTFCPQVFDPVCGCDGKTYSNACSASAAGVSVKNDGACGPQAPFCGGFAGLLCPGEGECVDADDDCDPSAGGADCSGVCECNDPHTCPAGGRFDTNPAVCACVRDAALCPNNPCAVTSCAAGTLCVERNCKAYCEPIRGPIRPIGPIGPIEPPIGGCGPCPRGDVCTDVCFPGPIETQ